MKIPNTLLPTSAALALALGLAMSPPLVAVAYAQSTSTPSAASTTSEATIKAMQEALNKQGIAVRADGVMNDETRNAIRKYQSQHHLPVTGEADKATLDKLGVVGQLGTPPSSTTTVGQGSTTSSAEHDHSHGAGGTTSGPMMHGMMQGMMQSMHGMMGMMRGQMQPDQKHGSMPGGPMMAQQGGPMNCPMMSASNQTSGPQMMQMMQMMQGMMQMMETMQKQMQSQQKP